MKPYYKSFLCCGLLAIGYLLCTASSCKNDEPSTPETELAKLPPETQEGKNTFGCLINGKAFLPKGTSSAGGYSTQCFYQFINSGEKQGYFFGLTGFDRLNKDGPKSVSVFADSVILTQSRNYVLKMWDTQGGQSGQYLLFDNTGNQNNYRTTETINGMLFLRMFDPIRQIISGTFSFDAINAKGEKVEIREGRFDMQYAK